MNKTDVYQGFDAGELIKRLPPFSRYSKLRVACVSSRDNSIYHVESGPHQFVVRFPGRQRYIDTRTECDHQNIASHSGLSPKVVWHDPSTGAIVTAWLTCSRPLKSSDLSTPARRNTLLANLATLHYLSTPFSVTLPLSHAIDWNLKGPAADHPRLRQLTGMARSRLQHLDVGPSVNCHGDLVRNNILVGRDDPRAVHFIDWEYSHCAPAGWDLSLLLNDIHATEALTHSMLADYNLSASRYAAEPVRFSTVTRLRGLAALVSIAWELNHSSALGDLQIVLDEAEKCLCARY